MSTRVTGGARRERHVTQSEEKERLLAVHAIAKNFVQYKHRLECSVSWYVMHMKYCKYEHRTCYCIHERLRLGLELAAELASLLAIILPATVNPLLSPSGGLFISNNNNNIFQGNPMAVFFEMSVWRSKNYLEFSIA